MFGLDEQIAALGDGQSLLLVLLVAVLLGLRHATDPDHLAAVSTLIASSPRDGVRRASALGLAWGCVHATTLLACGIPIVLAARYLPEGLQQATEAAVGVLIIALACRLLVRWRHGHFHAHAHRHGDVEHRHLHPHGSGHAHDHAAASAHDHAHEVTPVLGRSPHQAYGIGLVHGVGGSAGVGILLLAGIDDHALALVALVLLAACTAVSMSALSSGLGLALTRGPVSRRLRALTPALGAVSLAFGLWYTLGALDLVTYTL
jgi:ABC-type nickel/cobalt efflux system permease component RcnA